MSLPPRRFILSAIAAGALLAGAAMAGTFAMSSASAADSADLVAMSGTVRLPADATTVWAMTKDASSLCELVPVCSRAVAVPDRPGTFTLFVDQGVEVAGVASLGLIPVTVIVSDGVPGDPVGVRISFDEKLGSFSSDAVITMASDASGGTRMTYRTTSARGTGVLGRLTMAQLTGSFRESLITSAGQFAKAVDSQPATSLVVTKGRGRAGSPLVRAAVRMTPPPGFDASPAKGRMTVYVAGKAVCRTRIVNSLGSCSLRKSRKTVNAVVVVNGAFDNGLPFTMAKGLRVAGVSR